MHLTFLYFRVCTFLPKYFNMNIINKALIFQKLNLTSGYADDQVLPPPCFSPLSPCSRRLRDPEPRTSRTLLIPTQTPGSWQTLFHGKPEDRQELVS